MVSDFFYPNMGGVEGHLYCLSQQLIELGHKVVIVTHSYGNRKGVRYLSNGLKVYYIPFPVLFNQATWISLFCFFPVLRYIYIRERIDVAFSNLCHEGLFHARTLGLKCVFTDHSLFGFADTSSIFINKVLKWILSDIDKIICVSNTRLSSFDFSKENTVLRAALNPENVYVIPNAVLADQFKPDPLAKDPHHITIVVLSRLVYRKGMDLLVEIIPKIIALHPKVKLINFSFLRFLIAGDGPKKRDLEQMRERHLLHDKVEFLGPVSNAQARDILVRGHIFLNTSLTEAFCMAIVEAACCGLLVVSTKVGGVPEVLPKHMIILAKPDDEDLVIAVSKAIDIIRLKDIQTSSFHNEVREMYSWRNVAERTEAVYRSKSDCHKVPLMERLKRNYGCGQVAGKLACFVTVIDYLIMIFLEWLFPAESIDEAVDFPVDKYKNLALDHLE